MISMHTARVAPEKTDFSARSAAVLFAESFGESEMATKKLTYIDQLRHPNWQKKRLEMLEAADWKCTNCDSKDTTLHVHHKQYIKGRMAWEYNSNELVVLCEDCHEEEHSMADEIKELLAHIDTTQALALLRGFHANADWFDPWIGDMGRDRLPLTYAAGFTAFLMNQLAAEKMYLVAEFAVSLTDESAEERMIFPFYDYIFGKE